MSPTLARAALTLIVVALTGLRAGTEAAGGGATPRELGLPDYAAESPFRPFDGAASRALTSALQITADTRTSCPMAKAVGDFPDVRGNVCRAADASRIREVLGMVAPSLDPPKLALWKVDLDGDARAELVVAYSLVAAAGREAGHPYLALWLIAQRAEQYEPRYAGTYLAGQVHAVTRFGPARTGVLFVRSQSCAACRPWVFLHAIAFPAAGPPAAFFEFTYAPDHAAFGQTIEYARPGHGNGEDATIETRVPAPDRAATPHLIQLVRREDGRSEWWLFRCVGLRCDYERHAGRLPGQHLRAWLRGERL